MTVVIKKEDLISALDNGKVTFHADGDLTPTDVDEILRKGADRLADARGKSDVDIEPLFPNETKTKVTTHKGKRKTPQFCKTRA